MMTTALSVVCPTALYWAYLGPVSVTYRNQARELVRTGQNAIRILAVDVVPGYHGNQVIGYMLKPYEQHVDPNKWYYTVELPADLDLGGLGYTLGASYVNGDLVGWFLRLAGNPRIALHLGGYP